MTATLDPPIATRAAGLARLAAFRPRAGACYARDRNSDFGPSRRDNVSMMSPYLRHRLVTESELLAVIARDDKDGEAERFVAEVFWRTYFKGWLETRPSIWRRYRALVGDGETRLGGDPGSRDAYDRAIEGRTGIDAFDAFAHELVATGYLHNHARMWFASIWIFTLKLPWALGADFTLRHFIDGDPASNTLSWRWVAGLHTRGKTYLARRDNIERFTAGRFHPEGLALEAIALEEPEPPPASPLPPAANRPPAGRVALLLHEDDLHGESLDLGDAEVITVVGGALDHGRAAYCPSAQARAFKRGALSDGVSRAAAHFDVPVEAVSLASVDAVVAIARRLGLSVVVTPYAPVGCVADALDGVEAALRRHGIALIRLRRPYDERAWPHATRGFFPMRAKIPMLLQPILEGGMRESSAPADTLQPM